MSPWKHTALAAYYYATLPMRRRAAARRAAVGHSPVMVLFYHRIADDVATPWTASNRVFARQVRWLKKHFDLVSLAEAQRRIASAGNARPAVSITFDDGYADNCKQALPLLISERIPFTYFVATRHILAGRPFPHDVAAGFSLSPNTPDEILALARAGVEIGAHTRTHADLGGVDSVRLDDELAGSRDDIEAMTGRAPRFFAFPYGQHANLSAAAFARARELGFRAVCSAYGGYNFSGDDPFHLQRIHGDDDLLRLKNWLTLDARKLRAVRRFEYRETQRSLTGELCAGGAAR